MTHTYAKQLAIHTRTHSGKTESYQQIRTSDLIELAESQGWETVGTSLNSTRKGVPFHQRHVVRMRKVGESEGLELVIMNSHNGRGSLKVMAGWFRMACANGLVLGDNVIEPMIIRHVGKGAAMPNVERRFTEFVARAEGTYNIVNIYKSIELNQPLRLVFLLGLLNKLASSNLLTPSIRQSIGHFLNPRRVADQGEDLWTVLNVVQEHLIRGGQVYKTTTGRNSTRRAVRSQEKTVKLNQAVWEVAHEFAEHWSAA